MKLTITRQTVAQGRTVRPGDVVDVSEAEARILRSANKAVPAEDDAQVTAIPAPPPKPDDHQQRIAAIAAASASLASAEPEATSRKAKAKPVKKGH